MTDTVVRAAGRSLDGPTARLERLSYRYPDWSSSGAAALQGVDLELVPGLTLVTGDSGSGKSTLLRVLNGLVPHFHGGHFGGRATVCGLDVLATPTRSLARHVGFVFQEPEIGFVRGTVEREVAFGAENLGLPSHTIRRRVGEALQRSGIGALAKRRIATLSGGERQRVALAAALATSASVLVMDEPMSQLDEQGAAALHGALRELADQGHTIVVAEHRFDRFGAPDHLVPMAMGRVLPSPGLPAEDQGEPPRPRSFAGAPAAWSLDGVTVGIGRCPLVSDVSLTGAPGEVIVITGANGAGKTTLLRTIAGLQSPLAGTVERRPGRIAYLPQEPGVLLHRPTVRAEIEQTLRWSGAPGGASSVLETLGLAQIAERDPRDLSVGQRQRAALAVVLAGSPSLVLLDEPTRGMDGAARRSLSAALREVAGTGGSVVLATHDRVLADELGHTVLCIEDGRLVTTGRERER